jgi:hypothetical protein
MANVKISLRICITLGILSGLALWVHFRVQAQNATRQTTITISYTDYEWWLIRWTDNQILCQFKIDHDGLPYSDEVLKACGGEVQAEWQSTPPCVKIAKGGTDTSVCSGLYLHLIASELKEREVLISLPSASVWVNLSGCTPIPPENLCEELPSLVLTGDEPLPNERILSIEGTYNREPFVCESDICSLPLRITPPEGVQVEFWAESSYGDTSETFSAQVRVIDSGISDSLEHGGWYVDVLSSQWRGNPIASCTKAWQAFPPIGGLPNWLATPDYPQLLTSDEAYYYLGGRLISNGVVDTSACPGGGLLPNGYADACGLEATRPIVEAWQNQFDERIIDISKETGVPAQLMKNLFAQESQFWPGVFKVPYEFGLGQLTDNGADAVLLWDTKFFEQFCPLVLSQDACRGGYLQLLPGDQAILRGALALQAKTDCASCPAGVDLTHTNFSVSLFASTIQANCEQVAQIIYTATDETPGTVSTFEDLWRFTVANYHAGPGCLSFAIHMDWQSGGETITWEEVSENFTEACQGVIPYVNKITQ